MRVLGFLAGVGVSGVDRSAAKCSRSRVVGFAPPAGGRRVSLPAVGIPQPRALSRRQVQYDDLDEEFEDDGIVLLKDAETNKTIECVVERTVTVENTEYYLCLPCDDPVVLATMEADEGEDSVLGTVDDPDVMKELFSPAYEVLAQDGVTLQETAYIWTVIPEPEEGDFEDEDLEDEEEDEEDEDDPSGDSLEWYGEEEEVDVMASFFKEGVEYFVAKTVSPVYFITKMFGDEMRVPPNEELDRISPVIEAELEKEWDEEEGEIEKF